MSAENNEKKKPLLGDGDYRLRPFARRMAKEHPALWAKFIRACEREKVTESNITPSEFIARCTRAASSLVRKSERSNHV